MKASLAQPVPAPRPAGAPLALTLAALAAALVVAGAYLAGVEGGAEISLVALAIPGAAGVTLLALRRPVAAMTLVFALMAFSGALQVNWGVPVRPLVWILLGALIAATLISYLTTVRSRPAAIWPGVMILLAWSLYAAAHIPFAESAEIGWRGFLSGPSFVLVFLAVAYARWSEETRWRIFKGLIVVSFVTGAYALFRLFAGPTEAEEGISRLSAGIAGDPALFGSLPNRVYLGGFAAVLAPVLLTAALATRGRWQLTSTAAFVLMVVALFGSQVRIALVAAMIGIAVVIVLFQASRAFSAAKHGLVGLAVAGLLVTGALGYALTIADSPAKQQRFERIIDPGSDYSFRQRLRKWETALDQINREPFGQGLGTAGATQRQFAERLRLDNHYVDNSYLQLGIQLGYPGVLLLVGGAVLVFWLLAKSAVLTTNPRRATLGVAAAAALATWLVDLVGGNNYELWGAVVLWLVLGLGVGAFAGGSSAGSDEEAGSGERGERTPGVPRGADNGAADRGDRRNAGAPGGERRSRGVTTAA